MNIKRVTPKFSPTAHISVVTVMITFYSGTPLTPKSSDEPYELKTPSNLMLSGEKSWSIIAGAFSLFFKKTFSLFPSALQEIAAYRYPYQNRADFLTVQSPGTPALNAADPRVHTYFRKFSIFLLLLLIILKLFCLGTEMNKCGIT